MKKISIKKIIIVNVIAVITAAILAIMSKMLLPSDVNAQDFDSIIVLTFGFPAIAVFYFLLIYSHCAFTMQYFGRTSDYSKLQIGLRFGICFALIYFIGMQEVMVEASPFKTWGIDFLIYQFVMGIGEALVAIIMCVVISSLTLKNSVHKKPWAIDANKALSTIFKGEE